MWDTENTYSVLIQEPHWKISFWKYGHRQEDDIKWILQKYVMDTRSGLYNLFSLFCNIHYNVKELNKLC
jgi:hypothetical protein